VDAILRQLNRAAGESNYTYLVELGGPPFEGWEEDDDWDED
jgi:hypothetical protein